MGKIHFLFLDQRQQGYRQFFMRAILKNLCRFQCYRKSAA